jgi:hypothetical protein
MARDRSTTDTPDLFHATTGAQPRRASMSDSPAKAQPRTQIVLPRNLPVALRSLDEANFNTLVRHVVAEVRRRGPLTAVVAAEIAGVRATKTVRAPATPSRVDADRIPTGKANLIRAAFKAGIKPAAISREFRISQTVVRGVLASSKNSG